MKLKLLYLFRNLTRNPLRTLLTCAAVALPVMILVLSVSVLDGMNRFLDNSVRQLRLAVTQKSSLVNPLPVGHRAKIEALDPTHERLLSVCGFNWIGGTIPNDSRPLSVLAADCDTFPATFNEHLHDPSELAAWQREHRAIIVGRKTAEQFGWKLGDRITISPQVPPYGQIQFIIVSITAPDVTDTVTCFARRDYLEEIIKQGGWAEGYVGMLFVKCATKADLDYYRGAIDQLFANSRDETFTQDEKSFMSQFIAQGLNLPRSLTILASLTIFVAILAALNTMSMSFRDRLGEYATLRAMGFSGLVIGAVVLTEGIAVCLLGGLAGALGPYIAFTYSPLRRWSIPIIQVLEIRPLVVAYALAVAVGIGVVAAAWPAVLAIRLRVVQALRMLEEAPMALPLSYNWNNLRARKLSNGLTFVVVGVVVFVLSVLLSYAAGMRASMTAAGNPRNVITLKPGATSENTSALRPEEVNRIVSAPGIATLAADLGEAHAGSPMVSSELCVQSNLRRLYGTPDQKANVAARGVDDIAFAVHPEIRLIAGRRFQQGALEVIVGRGAQDRYANLALGDELSLGRFDDRHFRVVGVFEARGGAFESEIWAPRTMLADAYARTMTSSVCLTLTAPAAVPAAVDFINGPAVQLDAKSEPAYYDSLSKNAREIVLIATVLVAIMGIGAAFAVANTMYAAVDNRRREIAMLRTIGFGRRAIMLSIVIESVLICTLACAAGLAGSLLVGGKHQDYMSDATFTVFAYELRLTPGVAAAAMVTALLVGTVGALAPAIRAARMNILEAVRNV